MKILNVVPFFLYAVISARVLEIRLWPSADNLKLIKARNKRQHFKAGVINRIGRRCKFCYFSVLHFRRIRRFRDQILITLNYYH